MSKSQEEKLYIIFREGEALSLAVNKIELKRIIEDNDYDLEASNESNIEIYEVKKSNLKFKVKTVLVEE